MAAKIAMLLEIEEYERLPRHVLVYPFPTPPHGLIQLTSHRLYHALEVSDRDLGK